MTGHDEITDNELAELTVEELVFRAQGCRELTCMLHGKWNMELHRRGVAN